MPSHVWVFHTAERNKIVSVFPAPDSREVPLNSPISVTFLSPIEESSVTDENFRIFLDGYYSPTGELRYDSDTNTLTFSAISVV